MFERVRRSAFVPPHAHSRAQGDDEEKEDDEEEGEDEEVKSESEEGSDDGDDDDESLSISSFESRSSSAQVRCSIPFAPWHCRRSANLCQSLHVRGHYTRAQPLAHTCAPARTRTPLCVHALNTHGAPATPADVCACACASACVRLWLRD